MLIDHLRRFSEGEEWNANKGPLLSAQRRLVDSGCLDILHEALSIVPDGRITVTPRIGGQIDFDPRKLDSFQAILQWGARSLHGIRADDRGVSMDSATKDIAFGLKITAPIDSEIIRIESYRKSSPNYKGDALFFDEIFSVDDLSQRDRVEEAIAMALWRAGVKPQIEVPA